MHKTYENRIVLTEQRQLRIWRSRAATLVSKGMRGMVAACMALSVVAVAPVQPALAADTTAYYVSTSGNDTSGTGSSSSPWRTIQKAANTVPAGATVRVAAGTYNERVTIPATKSGTASSRAKFIADGAVNVSQGFVVQSSYTDLTGFEITPGATSGMSEYTGQVDIAGDYNNITGFNIHDITYGAGIGLRVGASYNTISDFKIQNVQWSGITTTNTYNNGSDHTTIRNGLIAHHRGRSGIDLSGNYHVVDGVTIKGGPSGTASGSLDGDGIRVNYNTGSVIRNTTITDLWEWYNDPQHTDCIQMWVAVKDLTIENCTLGTWEPGPPPSERGGIAQEIGPSQIIMVGTVSTNSYVSFTAKNNLFLGQTGTNASIVTAKNSGARIDIKLLNNTFWSAYPSLNSVDTAFLRNNIFREFYIYPANKSGIDSDYNIFCWLPTQGDNTLSTSEGSNSIGKTYSTRVDPATLFVNPDISSATNYGVDADFRPKSTSVSVGRAQAAYATTTDITGALRTIPADIGAYEYFGTVAAPAPADTTAPTVAITAPTGGSTVSGSVALAANASDSGSGVAKVEFRVDGVLVGTDSTAPYTSTWNATDATAGSHTIQARAIDVAGNAANASVSVNVPAPAPAPAPADTTAPTTTAKVEGSVGPQGWYLTVPTVSLSANEPATIRYQWDGTTGAWSTYSTALSAPQGSHTLYYYAVDTAGNVETPVKSVAFKVDSIAPAAPYGLTAETGTSTAILSWLPAADAVATKVLRSQTGYAASPTQSTGQTFVFEGPGGSATDSGLAADTLYYYTAFCRDAAGNWSAAAKTSVYTKALPVAAPVQQPTKLSARADYVSVKSGTSVKFTGVLTSADSVVADKTNVALYKSTDGGRTFVKGSSAKFDKATSTYVVTDAPRRKTVYEIRFGGDAGHAAARSAQIAIKVSTNVLAPVASTYSGSNLTMSLAVTTTGPTPSSVRLKGYRYEGGRWKYSKTWKAKTFTPLRADRGVVKHLARFKVAEKGAWRFRAVVVTENGMKTSARSRLIRARY